MKCYGNVKGRKYCSVQPEAKQTKKTTKTLCPACRKPKPDYDFWDGEVKRKMCVDCRLHSQDRQARSRERKLNDTEDMC